VPRCEPKKKQDFLPSQAAQHPFRCVIRPGGAGASKSEESLAHCLSMYSKRQPHFGYAAGSHLFIGEKPIFFKGAAWPFASSPGVTFWQQERNFELGLHKQRSSVVAPSRGFCL
jgi:hypothetical protein